MDFDGLMSYLGNTGSGTLWDKLGMSASDKGGVQQLNTGMDSFNFPNPVETPQIMNDFAASQDFTMTDPGVMIGGHRMDDPNVIHDPQVEVAPARAREKMNFMNAQMMKKIIQEGKLPSVAAGTSPQAPAEQITTVAGSKGKGKPEGEEKSDIWDDVGDWLSNKDNMNAVALGLNSMRMNPDGNIAQVLQGRLKDSREDKKSKKLAEAAVKKLVEMGREDLASAVAEGVIDPKKAMNMALKKQKPSSLQEKINLFEQDPKKFAEMKEAGVLGGSTTNVNVGGDAYGKSAGKGFFEQDHAIVTLAAKAPEIIEKADHVIKLLDSGKINTGFFAEWEQGVDRLAAEFGGRDAMNRATGTQLLDVALGSDVFPLIKQLGIGARGLDTPAEREFLRQVMTGTINMTSDTLRKMANMRKKSANDKIRGFNTKLESGQLDAYQSERGYKLQPLNFGKFNEADANLFNKYGLRL
ncbi:MAG: hypothetical protein NZ730_13640 [Porticoccaceae bacterium]|nr:hypothetical protein [Porticoccaceae bacterium]